MRKSAAKDFSLADSLLGVSVTAFFWLVTAGEPLSAADFTDVNYVSLGGMQGFDSRITAVAVDPSRGVVYVAGDFTVAGSIIANHIAKWDGHQWSALGKGLGYGSAQVYSLAVDDSGNLYVGGYFQTAGDTEANSVAKWDGSAWTPLGSGITYGSGGAYVKALLVDEGGNLYAGGEFRTAGGVQATNVAKWNGSAWAALGSGVTGTNLTSVNCLLDAGAGKIIVGGSFDNAGGVPANNIAQWNGTTWSVLGAGIGGSYPRVLALTMDSDGRLYAGGDFSSAGGQAFRSLAVWNGTDWAGLGSGLDDPCPWCVQPAVHSLLSVGNDLYVSGTFDSVGGLGAKNVAKWDGANWSAMSSGIGGNVFGARVYPLVLDLGGNLLAAYGATLQRWDGTNWCGFDLPLPDAPGLGVYGEIRSVATDREGNLYVGGSFIQPGGVRATNVAKWNGTNWSSLGAGLSTPNYYPPAYVYVYSMAFDPGGTLYAGGNFTSSGGVSLPGIAKWNGLDWSAIGPATGRLQGEVRALVFDRQGNLYAGGSFAAGQDAVATNIAKWDGNAWLPLGGGLNGPARALAVDANGNLYAGGRFTMAGTVSATNVAKWNGASWSALGTGILKSWATDSAVEALVVDAAGTLYAGGGFTNAGGILTPNVAKWDGKTWAALAQGLGGDSANIKDLAFDATGTLYACGYNVFRLVSGQWKLLGSGLSDRSGNFVEVNAMAVGGLARLYLGGVFSIAGTNVSVNIAQANILTELSRPVRGPDGSFGFDVITIPTSTNRILATTNWAAWQPIWTNVAPRDGRWHFMDTITGQSSVRFYRSSMP